MVVFKSSFNVTSIIIIFLILDSILVGNLDLRHVATIAGDYESISDNLYGQNEQRLVWNERNTDMRM